MIVLCFRGVFKGARRNGTLRLAQFNHFRGEKHNCLVPLPLSWCYACCVCCASCVFRSGASESASGSLPTRSTRSAWAKRFTPIIPPPFFFAMLSSVYSATHLHWFPLTMEVKRAHSNDNCLLPMRLPWCYIAHVCWVFCVLSFFACDVASGAVLRVLRALQHVFVPTFIGRFAFMVQEPCLHPCTPLHILNGCRRVGSWESGSIRRHRGMDTRENKGCKEAAGVHSCAGRRGTGLFTCLWSCLLSAFGVLHVLRGLHVRFCVCLWICLPMSYLFCALCMFYRQAGRSMGIRSSMGIRMSRDTSMSRGTSTSR